MIKIRSIKWSCHCICNAGIFLLLRSYKQGMVEATGVTDGDGPSEIQTATEQVLEIAEWQGVDAVDGEEVDELLSWTSGLNFEE